MNRDPLAAVPLRPEGVELRRDSAGLIHLRRQEPVGRWKAAAARWLGHDYSRKLALDATGTAFYEAVDGTATLRQIADHLAAATGEPAGEVTAAVVAFVRSLMSRRMLDLRISPDGRESTP